MRMPIHLPRRRWQPPRARVAITRLQRWSSCLLVIMLAGISAMVLEVMYRNSMPLASPIPPAAVPSLEVPIVGAIEVIDGGTVRRGGHVYRLVGFDAPETGTNAR